MVDGKCRSLNRAKIVGLVCQTVEHDETIANLATVPRLAVQPEARAQLKPQCEQAIGALRLTDDNHLALVARQTPAHFLAQVGQPATD